MAPNEVTENCKYLIQNIKENSLPILLKNSSLKQHNNDVILRLRHY